MNFCDLMKKVYKKRTLFDYILYVSVIFLGILVDQLTKFLTVKFMYYGQSVPVIKGIVNLTYTTNDGAAFGMLDGEVGRIVFMTVSSVMIVLMSLYLFFGHAETKLYAVSISMIISGGIGNMVDRLGFGFYVNPETGLGEVVDFIEPKFIDFAIFNGADSFVCVGAGLLILALILDIIKEYKAEKEKKNGTRG